MAEDKNESKKLVPKTATEGILTKKEFRELADVPPEIASRLPKFGKITSKAYLGKRSYVPSFISSATYANAALSPSSVRISLYLALVRSDRSTEALIFAS